MEEGVYTYLVCTACGLLPPVPRTENFNSGWPATISAEGSALVVVPHRPDCWRLTSAARNAEEIERKLSVVEVPGGVRYDDAPSG
jgi:hypothetical protein